MNTLYSSLSPKQPQSCGLLHILSISERNMQKKRIRMEERKEKQSVFRDTGGWPGLAWRPVYTTVAWATSHLSCVTGRLCSQDCVVFFVFDFFGVIPLSINNSRDLQGTVYRLVLSLGTLRRLWADDWPLPWHFECAEGHEKETCLADPVALGWGCQPPRPGPPDAPPCSSGLSRSQNKTP